MLQKNILKRRSSWWSSSMLLAKWIVGRFSLNKKILSCLRRMKLILMEFNFAFWCICVVACSRCSFCNGWILYSWYDLWIYHRNGWICCLYDGSYCIILYSRYDLWIYHRIGWICCLYDGSYCNILTSPLFMTRAVARVKVLVFYKNYVLAYEKKS